MNTMTLASLADLLTQEGLLAGVHNLTSEKRDSPVTGTDCDSRAAAPGHLFVCKGRAFKADYLLQALQKGAVAYLCDADLAPQLAEAAPQTPAFVACDLRRAMAVAAGATFGRPDLALPLVGITGTKGKSTTAYMLRSIVDAAHGKGSCGVIGSIDTYDGVEDAESTNTTPEAPDLWRHLANARDSKRAAMVMEVSSQALKYDRTLGVELGVAAFLNIGTDHISPVEHPDFEDYFTSKLKIFSQCRRAVVNLGTRELGRVLAAASAAESVVCVSAAGAGAVDVNEAQVKPDIWAEDVDPQGARLCFTACGREASGDVWHLPVTISFPGLFNVENALVAIACAELMGIDRASIASGLEACRVPGRMELIGDASSKVLCVVDYAHNKLSYQSFFSSMRKEFPGRRIVALIGAPGGKAFERRVELPQMAARWASHIVTTEEDPAHDRNEDICAEMDANIPADARLEDGTPVTHEVVLNRQEAVARCLDVALSYAEPSLVCLLGKGDETLIHRGDEFQTMVPDGEAFLQAARERGLSY